MNTKNIHLGVKIATFALILFFFLPMMVIDTMGFTDELKFSALNFAIGQYQGEEMGVNYPLAFAIPVLAVLVLVFVEKNIIVSAACAGGYSIGMIILNSTVKDELGVGSSLAKASLWYTLSLILGFVIAGILMYEKFILQNPQNKQKVANMFGNANNGPQQGYGAPQQGYGAPQQGYGAPQQGYGAPQGYAPQNNAPVCAQCGAPLTPGTKFCARCGAPAPAPAPQNVEKFCSACGTKCAPGTAFCPTCGNKMN